MAVLLLRALLCAAGCAIAVNAQQRLVAADIHAAVDGQWKYLVSVPLCVGVEIVEIR